MVNGKVTDEREEFVQVIGAVLPEPKSKQLPLPD